MQLLDASQPPTGQAGDKAGTQGRRRRGWLFVSCSTPSRDRCPSGGRLSFCLDVSSVGYLLSTMSGLEAVAAFALACNILQVIGVAHETIRVAKQVYENGELNPALKDHATHLDDIVQRVKTMMIAPATTTTTAATTVTLATTNNRDKQLLELADRCMSTAKKLRKEVDSLSCQPSASNFLGMVKTTCRTILKKKRLETLEDNLRDAERLLQTGLLTGVYEQVEKTDGVLAKLDADLRSFVDEYRKGRVEAAALARDDATRLRDLIENIVEAYVTQAEISLKTHISQATQPAEALLRDHISTAADLREDARLEARRERLLRSLKFDRMNERSNMVVDSHPETFKWVLVDGSQAEGTPWGSFPDWLQSAEPQYWISGKPGSGKTTLVKYLLGHSRTRELLDLWSPGCVIVSHFFWRPGTQMQQSIKGLLCSLLYQLLDKDKSSLDRILASNVSASNKDIETDWSRQELESMLVDVMACYPKHMAFFLDGLDEVLPADGTLALLNFVDTLKRSQGLQGKVKLCLGARREPLIERKLRAYPHLRLEHLNYSDLRRYAENTIIIPSDYTITILQGSSMCWRISSGKKVTFDCENLPTSQEIRDWLVTELVNKAEGVFLWLSLTARATMQALDQDDSITDLKHRIDSLPSDLTKLYADMWARANGDRDCPELQGRAALYFHLAINKMNYTDRLSLMIATSPGLARKIIYRNSYEPEFATWLLDQCKAKMRDIENRCGGLLQVKPILGKASIDFRLQPWYGKEYCDLIPYADEGNRQPPFEFVHRTARDFLTDTVEGLRILGKHKMTRWHLEMKATAANLARCRLFWMSPAYQIIDHKFYTFHSEYSCLSRYLARISSLLDEASEGNKENAIGECDELLRFCEHLFESGHLFADQRLLEHPEDFQREGIETNIVFTRYEVVVKREHEFLLEAAAIGTNIWPFIQTKVQSLNLDEQTLSELLVHVCNVRNRYRDSRISSLSFKSRLELARLLLERGACPSRKGPRRIGSNPLLDSDLVHVLETPLKALISSVWNQDRDARMMDSNLTRHYIDFFRLLLSNGANLDEEIFRVTYTIKNGRLLESLLFFYRGEDVENLDEGTLLEGIQFVLTYPLSVILARMLQSWKNRFPEVDTSLGPRDTIQKGSKLGSLTLILHSKGTPARMCFVEAEEKLEEELLWVAREVEGILQARGRGSYSVPVPLEIQQGLSRALQQRDPEGVEKSQVSRRFFELLQRAGMTSIYWREWEDGSQIRRGTEFGN